MITREELLARRAEYETAKNLALNQANANQGAIEAIDWVLMMMDKKPDQALNLDQLPKMVE